MTKYNPVTHCLFDMDGLLLNTEDLYTEAYETCLKRVDREYTFETKAKLMGRKPLESAAILLKELNLEDKFTPESWIATVSEEYPKVFPKCALLPGVQRLIDHLVANNVPIAISTGSSNEAFDLKATNHTKFFTNFLHIVKCGSDPDVKNGKPAPDAFEVCRQRFSPVPEAKNCLAFEDAPNGVKSAIAAGMQVVMVPDSRLSQEGRKDATVCLSSMLDFKPEEFGLPPF